MKYELKITVTCPTCKTRFNEEDVKFLNIEEDMQGWDLLTFECPICKEPKKAYRR